MYLSSKRKYPHVILNRVNDPSAKRRKINKHTYEVTNELVKRCNSDKYVCLPGLKKHASNLIKNRIRKSPKKTFNDSFYSYSDTSDDECYERYKGNTSTMKVDKCGQHIDVGKTHLKKSTNRKSDQITACEFCGKRVKHVSLHQVNNSKCKELQKLSKFVKCKYCDYYGPGIDMIKHQKTDEICKTLQSLVNFEMYRYDHGHDDSDDEEVPGLTKQPDSEEYSD